MLCNELVNVQELLAPATVERLNQPVVGGLAGPGVVEFHIAPISPLSIAFEVNSVPLSTVIALGQPRSNAA